MREESEELPDAPETLGAPETPKVPDPIAAADPIGAPAPPTRFAAGRAFLRRYRGRILLGLATATGLYLLVAWLTWPDVRELKDTIPESTAFIDRYLDRTGASGVAWTPVPYSRISAHLKEAVVVSEDLEFFSHGGFSSYEIKQAIKRAIEERAPPRGASTLTQQLAKNLWLSPSRSVSRKGREVLLTLQLEKHLSKARILDVYLNVVEFGPGVYGAEAAARHYFGKSAVDLSAREAAMLAAGLPRPSRWHPGVETPGYRRRVETILARMREVEFLDRRFGGAPVPEASPPVEPELENGGIEEDPELELP
jgi:monofunctional biosynthetic peptidoglycan transglycosylase